MRAAPEKFGQRDEASNGMRPHTLRSNPDGTFLLLRFGDAVACSIIARDSCRDRVP